MEKEISETYYYNPADFDNQGRRVSDGTTLREVIKEFERDFHQVHSSEYALNLYASSQTMGLLARSCDAAPFLSYGMDLTQGRAFDAEKDPEINHEMDKHSKHIFVYGIDSAFMSQFDDNGYPVLDDNSDIFPLTLLIDEKMRNDSVRLAVPNSEDNEEAESVTIDLPHFVYA